MNQIINSPTVITEKTGWTVFLAGPMKASPRGWRNKLVKAASEMGMDNITFISPRFNTMHQPSNQIEWETQGKFLAKRYGVKVNTSMEGCLKELKVWIEKQKPKVHYIAAPGFDSKEQLAAHPEFVDLLAMNQTLMERWNRIVAPGDTVYVVGNFGNKEWMRLLNGDIRLTDSSSTDGFVSRKLL